MFEIILTLYSIAGSTASFAPYLSRFKDKIGFSKEYDDILFDAMKSAVKEVTGKDISKFKLKGEVAIYEKALELFEVDRGEEVLASLDDLISVSDLQLKLIQYKFIENLISSGNEKILTFLSLNIIQNVKKLYEEIIIAGGKLDQLLDNQHKGLEKANQFFNKFPRLLKSEYSTSDIGIEHRYIPQEAPSIQDNFIKRIDSIKEINGSLQLKSILFLHGIARSGKSILISQFIDEFYLNKYYWFDFNLFGSKDINLFFLDLVRFINAQTKNSNALQASQRNFLNPIEIVDNFKSYCSDLDSFLFVFDNVHLVDNIEVLGSFISLLLQKLESNIKIVLISEEGEIINKTKAIIDDFIENRSDGFNKTEMKELFNLNGISTDNASDKFINLIHYTTGGHPDILNGLISEILVSDDMSLQNNSVIINIVNGFKDLPAALKITQILINNIGSKILTSEEEKILFARLSCLVGNFSEELAEYISKVNPEITNFAVKFQKIKSKLLDIEPGNKFSMPRLFKKVATEFITVNERKKIFYSAGQFFSHPQNNIIRSDDALSACDYFFLSGEISEALRIAIFLLQFVLTKVDDNKSLIVILERLNILIEIKLDKEYINHYVGFASLCIEGYRRLDFIKEQSDIAAKIQEGLQNPGLDKGLKSMAAATLFIHNIMVKNNLDIAIENFKIFNENFTESELPISSRPELNIKSILKNMFYWIGYSKDTSITDLIRILNLCLECNLKLKEFFQEEELSDYLDILYGKLYKIIKAAYKDDTNLLNKTTVELESLASIFKDEGLFIGVRDIHYIIGILKIDLSENPLNSLIHFDDADSLHQKHKLLDNNFDARNQMAKADAYYREDQFQNALDFYLQSINKFKREKAEYLILHCYLRSGICYYQTGKITKCEKYLWDAVGWARTVEKKKKDNLFIAFSELSTFYVLTKNYVRALKCFSILISILEEDAFSPKHQLISQSIAWINEVKRGEINDQNKVIKVKDKEWFRPYWGLYTKEFDYVDERATKLSLLYVLASSFELHNIRSRAKIYYQKILDSNINNETDKSVKYISLIEFVKILIEQDDLTNLSDNVPLAIQIVEDNLKTGTFNLNSVGSDVDHFSNILIQPLKDKYLLKYDSLDSFSAIEKFFIRTKSSISNVNTSLSIKINCELSSMLGWLYTLNMDLDNSFKSTAENWLNISNEVALQKGLTITFLNNRLLQLFWLQDSIFDLKGFLKSIFEFCLEVIKHWNICSVFCQQLNERFVLFFNTAKVPSDVSTKDLEIMEIFQNIGKKFNGKSLNDIEKFVSIQIGFIKVRLDINLDYSSTSITSHFILDNFTKYHIEQINEILDSFHSISRKLAFKSLSDKSALEKFIRDTNDRLRNCKKEKSDILSPDINKHIDHIIIDMKKLL